MVDAPWLAKADENRASCRENSVGASGEVDLDNGGSDAVILDDPERARLSESMGVVVR